MLSIQELINIGLEDGIDKSKLLNIMAKSLDSKDSPIETFEKLYCEIYDYHLCDKLCCKMVDKMFNITEKGKKWTLEQTNDVARKIGITFTDENYTQHEFWCAMHMVYYDYMEALVESGISDALIYGKMADSYLDDVDGPKGKLKDYFFSIEKNNNN